MAVCASSGEKRETTLSVSIFASSWTAALSDSSESGDDDGDEDEDEGRTLTVHGDHVNPHLLGALGVPDLGALVDDVGAGLLELIHEWLQPLEVTRGFDHPKPDIRESAIEG